MFRFIRGLGHHIRAIWKGTLSNKTAWFYTSDGNKLEDCGPNCTAMAAAYSSGTPVRGRTMNTKRPEVIWWSIPLCQRVLTESGYKSSIDAVVAVNQRDVAGIFHVRTNHLVFTILDGAVAHVYDPLSSPYEISRQAFLATVTYPQYVFVQSHRATASMHN